MQIHGYSRLEASKALVHAMASPVNTAEPSEEEVRFIESVRKMIAWD